MKIIRNSKRELLHPIFHKNKIYNLIAIVYHGGNAKHGHYTSAILNNNNWFYFNDDQITYISDINVLQCNTHKISIYCLFYQR